MDKEQQCREQTLQTTITATLFSAVRALQNTPHNGLTLASLGSTFNTENESVTKLTLKSYNNMTEVQSNCPPYNNLSSLRLP